MAAEDSATSEPEQNTIGGGHVEGPSIFLRKGRAVLEEALAGARESKDWQSLGDAAHDLAVLVGGVMVLPTLPQTFDQVLGINVVQSVPTS